MNSSCGSDATVSPHERGRRPSLKIRRSADLKLNLGQLPSAAASSPSTEHDLMKSPSSLLAVMPEAAVPKTPRSPKNKMGGAKVRKSPVGLLDMSLVSLTSATVTPSSPHPLSAVSPALATAAAPLPYSQEPVEILPGLFLGSEKNAASKRVLMRKNIRYVINVGIECCNHFGARSADQDTLEGPCVEDEDIPLSPVYNPLNLVQQKSRTRRNSSSSSRAGATVAQVSPKRPASSPLSGAVEEMHHLTINTQTRKNSITNSLISRLHSGSRSTVSSLSSDEPSPLDLSDFVPPQYLKLPWTHNQEDIQTYFNDAFAFIGKALQEGSGVLVHCKQGLSRSASLVIAYVMWAKHMKSSEAYNFVKRLSPAVSPNLGFIYQLLEYEKSLDGLKS